MGKGYGRVKVGRDGKGKGGDERNGVVTGERWCGPSISYRFLFRLIATQVFELHTVGGLLRCTGLCTV